MSREWEYYHHYKKIFLLLSHIWAGAGGPGLDQLGRIRLIKVWSHVLLFFPQWSLNIPKIVIQWMEEEPWMTFKSDPKLIWHPLANYLQWPHVDPSWGSDVIPTVSQQIMTMRSLSCNFPLCLFLQSPREMAYPPRCLSSFACQWSWNICHTLK